jgi:hypothetical protein
MHATMGAAERPGTRRVPTRGWTRLGRLTLAGGGGALALARWTRPDVAGVAALAARLGAPEDAATTILAPFGGAAGPGLCLGALVYGALLLAAARAVEAGRAWGLWALAAAALAGVGVCLGAAAFGVWAIGEATRAAETPYALVVVLVFAALVLTAPPALWFWRGLRPLRRALADAADATDRTAFVPR